ncbi:MAG: TonB family protein [Candidatus Kaistia colombiensis]|nr:MAG: TonB family protein [Kaistia sp.]
MGIRRSSWVWALILSIAAHGAVVAAFTPDANEVAEAGGGAGSEVEGSIDATLGTDVEVADLFSEELRTASDTEVVPVAEPVTLVALAPSPIDAEPNARLAEAASATGPTESLQAMATAELTPVEPPASTVTPVLVADISATPIESDLAAVAATELTEVAPTEALAAIPPTPQEAATTEPATSPRPETIAATALPAVKAEPVEQEALKPVQTAMLTAVKPPKAEELISQPRAAEELLPLPEAKPVEAKPAKAEPVETKPAEKVTDKAEPTRKPREKAEKAEKTRKAEAPKRGNAEADSRQGAAETTRNASARDSGIGRSREAGAGAAANSNYKGKVQAAIRRMTRMPSKAARLGISGRAQVSFTVTPSGAARNIVLASSTGNALLDDAALSAVRKASPFPPMPNGMPQLDLNVPIVFNIGR